MLVFGDYVYFTHPEGGARGLEPWREVAEFLKSKSQADDAALFSPDAARLPYLWYAAKLAGKGPRCLGYPRTLDPGSEILYREDGAPESAETNLQAGLAPAGRVWLVSCGASGKARQARELIAQRGQSLGQYEFGRINLELFAIK